MKRIIGYKQIRCSDCGKNKVEPIFEEIIEEKPQNFMDSIGEPCKCERKHLEIINEQPTEH